MPELWLPTPTKKCPAFGKSCLKCGKGGHFSKVCLTSGSSDRKIPPKGFNAVFISSILSACTNHRDTLPRIDVTIGKDFAPSPQTFPSIADTGAEVNVIGEKYLHCFGIKPSMLNPPKKKLKHVAGGEILVIGSCWLSFEVNENRHIEETFFVAGISDIFLSLSACRAGP